MIVLFFVLIRILLVDFISVTFFYSVKIVQKLEFEESFKNNTGITYVCKG